VKSAKQVFEHPQVVHRNMKLSLPHSSGVDVPGVANPIRLSETPIRYDRSAPTLGEHNQVILKERLGLSNEYIANLTAKGVVASRDPPP
jgi:crotonobetainyl-CoA:carnitine CoA-transferase CaiB-like acyl-CoA transferase